MPLMPVLRPMQAADSPGVLAIQQSVYPPEFHEDWAVLGAKLRLFPAGCWVAEAAAAGVCAYLFSHPIQAQALTPLHQTLEGLPLHPDSYLVHDLALLGCARGQGLAQALVDQALKTASSLGLGRIALVAVQGSEPFWRRQGFKPAATSAPSSYGAQALQMQRFFGLGAPHTQANPSAKGPPNTM
jgi:hypothetical protein